MSTTRIRNSPSQNTQPHLSLSEKCKAWTRNHSTALKVCKIAALSLGLVLLLSTAPLSLTTKIIISAGAGAIAIIKIITSQFRKASSNQLNHPQKTMELWSHLQQKTIQELQGVKFFSEKEVNHRFSDVPCPKKTAVLVEGCYLHANNLGKGISTDQRFIASQAPLEKDFEIFWKAILKNQAAIFDLTTPRDSGITKYYPEELNSAINYGSISVKLTKFNSKTSIYQITNTKTGTIKTIKRYHYTDWKDFGAISVSSLDTLVKEAERMRLKSKDLLWVHCRAGVGRTGTLITAIILKEKIINGEITKDNLDSSLLDLIVKLRKQRGPSFVQEKVQLNLLYEYANFLLSNSFITKNF